MNIIRYFLSCLIISIFFFSSSSAQMPPHPLLLEKIERNEIAVPYTLDNIDLLRKNGIDEPWSSPDIQLEKQSPFARRSGSDTVPSGNWKAFSYTGEIF